MEAMMLTYDANMTLYHAYNAYEASNSVPWL